MRMRKMRHPALDAVIDVPETAVAHHERAGWEPVDSESTGKAHPANTPSQDPADLRVPAGVEAPSDPDAAAKPSNVNGGRRPRSEGSA